MLHDPGPPLKYIFVEYICISSNTHSLILAHFVFIFHITNIKVMKNWMYEELGLFNNRDAHMLN